jgi:hypothetical protein
MKVKELIAILQECNNPELPVVLSIDEEGNNYHEARDTDDGQFWSKEDGTVMAADELQEYGSSDSVRAFVIWP